MENDVIMVLAGVDISFRRQIRPYQAYEVPSYVQAWDDRWFYVTTRVATPGWTARAAADKMQDKNKDVFAVATSRYIFKAGRRTLPPTDMLLVAGYGDVDHGAESFERVEDLRLRSLGDLRSFA